MQWNLIYQSNHSPSRLYLSQVDVRNLAGGWTNYWIEVSTFHRWKKLLGEANPGYRQSFYSNYLLAKFVRYAELMIRFGDEVRALDEFWGELDAYVERVQQESGASRFSQGYQRQLLQEEYVNDTLATRTAVQDYESETSHSTRVWQQSKGSRIITVPISARAV